MTALLADIYGNVHSALKQQLKTVSGIPADALWATENVDFEKPSPTAGTPWLRETFDPQPNVQASLGNVSRKIRQPGVWTLQLFVPKNSGKQYVEGLAGRIVAAFAPGGTLSYGGQLVDIRSAFATRGLPEPDWYAQLVTITWRADNYTP